MPVDSKKIGSTIPVRCVWGLLCSLSSIDQERNNISLFNVIDQINLPQAAFAQQAKSKKPLVIPFSYEIVLHWRRAVNLEALNDELGFDFRAKLIDPKGVVLGETLVTGRLEKNIVRSRFRIKTNGLLVTVPGDYLYVIEVKKDDSEEFGSVFEIPFTVRVAETIK